MNILVAEDDKFLASAYRLKLTRQGWDVTVVSDGNEVLKYLATAKPDLLLLDLIMPNMDGFEVLEKIKTLENGTNLPVVVASNLGQKEDINRALSLGALDFVIKSEVSLDALVAKIVKILA